MSARYRIVYFTPDPFAGERVALGALIDTADGLRLARVGELPGAQCLGSDLAHVAARLVAESLGAITRYEPALPPFVSPQATLGREVAVPDGVVDPVAFVTEHVLPQRPPRKQRTPRAPSRGDEGQRFFDSWGVGQFVQRGFRPREWAASEVPRMFEALPEISQYVAGSTDLLLMEPIVATRSALRGEARDVVQRFLAYAELEHRHLLRPASLVAYVLPSENPARTAEAMELVRGAAQDVVDLSLAGEREMFVKRVRMVGESARLPNLH